MALSRLSYLIKVPLALCVVSFISAVGVFIATYYLLASNFSAEAMTRMQQISNSLARSVRLSIRHDELWDLHQQIQSVIRADAGTQILILTDRGQTLVASDSMKYPVMGDPQSLPTPLRQLGDRSFTEQTIKDQFELNPGTGNVVFAAATAVLSEDGDALCPRVDHGR